MMVCIRTHILMLLGLVLFLHGCSEPIKPEKPVVNKLSSASALEIKKYLQENFGVTGATTTWYHDILSVSVQENTVHVKTDLKPDSPKINTVCGAVYNWFVINKQSYVLDKIRLSGVNGEIINNRLNPENEKCWP